MVDSKIAQEPLENPQEPLKIKISKKKVYVIATVLGVCLLLIIGFFLLPKSVTRQMGIAGVNPSTIPGNGESNTADTTGTNGKKPDTAIAKVGNEYIYQSDLDTELATYPVKKDEAVKKMLLNKLVKDSIVLQAAKKTKLIAASELDTSIYNSADKNYMKRVEEIQAIEEKVNKNVDQISGVIISIWFNNMFPPKMGLEAGKKEAFRRITDLRKRVMNKEITIDDAGRLVTSDPSLDELDPGHQNNGLVSFSVTWGKRITIDDKFDAAILKLQQGQTSEVFLGSNVNSFTDKLEEAFYAFAQVKSRVGNGNTKDFTAWYDDQKKNYEVTYY